jgi:hypothetical protein
MLYCVTCGKLGCNDHAPSGEIIFGTSVSALRRANRQMGKAALAVLAAPFVLWAACDLGRTLGAATASVPSGPPSYLAPGGMP